MHAVIVVVQWLCQNEAIQILIFNRKMISVAIIKKLCTYKKSGNKVWT